jgi:hypothetical protein
MQNKASELMRLESKHDYHYLCAELKTLTATFTERNVDVKTLDQRDKPKTDLKWRSVAQSDLQFSERQKQGALETMKKTARDLSTTREELKVSNA